MTYEEEIDYLRGELVRLKSTEVALARAKELQVGAEQQTVHFLTVLENERQWSQTLLQQQNEYRVQLNVLEMEKALCEESLRLATKSMIENNAAAYEAMAALEKIRDVENEWRAGNIVQLERESRVTEAVSRGLGEPVPEEMTFIESFSSLK